MLPALGAQAFGASPFQIGLLTAAEPAGALLTGLALSTRRGIPLSAPLMVGGCAFFMLCLLVVASAGSLPVAVGVLMVGGIGTALFAALQTALPFDEAEWYTDLGAAPFGDPDYTVRERTTVRPTVEVNGMWGGYTGTGGKTVLPCEAHAKLTMRLVPGQEPAAAQAAVKRHLEAQCPPGVALEFHYRPGDTRAFVLGPQHPLLLAAERVTEWIHGRRPVRTRAGGTVPITTLFHESLGIDSLIFGLAMPDEDAHAPNEFFRLSSLDEGLLSWPLLLTELGALVPEDFPKHPRD